MGILNIFIFLQLETAQYILSLHMYIYSVYIYMYKHIHICRKFFYFVSHYIILRLFQQTILSVEILDEEEIDSDVIDNFEVIINCSVFYFDKFNPLTINGTRGIGRITLAFYNLIINPTSCDTEAIPTITGTS